MTTVHPKRSRTVAVTLQFDGSFRPPKDPGYPTIPRRVAVAAACIQVHVAVHETNRIQENEQIRRAVGSRILPNAIGMTSQQAEYEGLLLGLEWLHTNIDRWIDTNDDDNDDIENIIDGNGNLMTDVSFLIQGDCKTVIDQMKGNAVSRKLQESFIKAKTLVNEILQQCRNNKTTIHYVLIPRRESYLPDSVCRNCIYVMALKAWTECISDLETMQQKISISNAFPSTKTRNLRDFLSKHLHPTRSLLKRSLRPILYTRLAVLAYKMNDYESLIGIGERLCDESSIHVDVSTQLRVLGVKYQMDGWHGMGMEKRANALRRKHRQLLCHEDLLAGDNIITAMESVAFDDLRLIGDIKEELDPQIISSYWGDILEQWLDMETQGEMPCGEGSPSRWVEGHVK